MSCSITPSRSCCHHSSTIRLSWIRYVFIAELVIWRPVGAMPCAFRYFKILQERKLYIAHRFKK